MPASQKYLKIAGSAANYSDADAVTLSFSTSAPAQANFVLQREYTDTLPVVGNSVEWFRRDDTKVWAGVISEVDIHTMWESGGRLNIPIIAVGYDDRLFHRTTWNAATFRCAQYRSFTGKVSTSGTAVTWVSNVVSGAETSNRFGVELAGKSIGINGSPYTVASVDTPEHITLSSSAGTQTGVDYAFIIYSGDVVRDLLDGGSYPSGLLGGGYANFEGFTWTGTSIQRGAPIDNKGLLFDPPVSIHDAIQTVLGGNPDFYFAVDVNQVAYFAVRTLVSAPGDFTPTSGKQKRKIQVKITAEDVRNVEISNTTFDAIDPTVDTFNGNSGGTLLSWFTTKPIHEVMSVTLNGVDATFADGSSTTVAKFYFTTNGNEVWQDHSDPPVLDTDVIVVSYKALAANLIEYELNPTDPGGRSVRAAIEGSGFGRYEKPMDRTNFAGKTPAQNDAIASVSRLAANYYTVPISTFETGYMIGQVVTLDAPTLQVSAMSLFIDEISMTDQDTKGSIYDFEYTLTCISVTRRITETQVLRDAFGGGGNGSSGGGGSISGGGGGGTPTTTATATVTTHTITHDDTVSSPGTPASDGLLWVPFIIMDATGQWDVSWGTGVNGAPPINPSVGNAEPNTTNVLMFVSKGSAWYFLPTTGAKI